MGVLIIGALTKTRVSDNKIHIWETKIDKSVCICLYCTIETSSKIMFCWGHRHVHSRYIMGITLGCILNLKTWLKFHFLVLCYSACPLKVMPEMLPYAPNVMVLLHAYVEIAIGLFNLWAAGTILWPLLEYSHVLKLQYHFTAAYRVQFDHGIHTYQCNHSVVNLI